MTVDVKVNVNSIEITNLLKKISRKQKAVITKSLNRVSNMAILMITKRTQAGKLPDGGKKKTTRPFFAIGNKEEDKIIKEFQNFYFKEMRL